MRQRIRSWRSFYRALTVAETYRRHGAVAAQEKAALIVSNGGLCVHCTAQLHRKSAELIAREL